MLGFRFKSELHNTYGILWNIGSQEGKYGKYMVRRVHSIRFQDFRGTFQRCVMV